MKNVLNFIKVNKFNICVILCYLIITITTMLHHEIWRDEAQVWCIVRDCNLPETVNMARVEGHPLLWYFLIMPFAKIGLPVISMQIISLIMVFLSVIILIFKFPFSNFQKIIFVFSAGMLYYFPTVARNYALIPLLLFLISYFWKEKINRPFLFSILIILLSHTHVYMLGCCLGIFLIFAYENIKNKRAVIPLLMLFLNFIGLFLFFHHVQNQNYAIEVQGKNFPDIYSLILFICQIYIHPIIAHIPPLIRFFNSISIIAFIPCLLVILYKFFKLDKKVFIISVCSIGFLLSVFYFVYLNGIIYQKTFLILLLLLFCYSLINTKDKILTAAVNTLFIISFIVSPFVINSDIKYNFSGGKQTAQYIKQNLNNEDIFIALGNPYIYSSISAYLPDKKIYNVISKSYISHFTYAFYDRNKQEPPEGNFFYIIQNNITSDELDKMGFKILFQSDKENISSRTEQEIFQICLSTEEL